MESNQFGELVRDAVQAGKFVASLAALGITPSFFIEIIGAVNLLGEPSPKLVQVELEGLEDDRWVKNGYFEKVDLSEGPVWIGATNNCDAFNEFSINSDQQQTIKELVEAGVPHVVALYRDDIGFVFALGQFPKQQSISIQ